MRIGCNRCGKSVSSEVPEGTVVRAWVECPECTEAQPEPNADDTALVEMAAWLKADKWREIAFAYNGEHPTVMARWTPNRSMGWQARTIAEAWAALRAQSGWPK